MQHGTGQSREVCPEPPPRWEEASGSSGSRRDVPPDGKERWQGGIGVWGSPPPRRQYSADFAADRRGLGRRPSHIPFFFLTLPVPHTTPSPQGRPGGESAAHSANPARWGKWVAGAIHFCLYSQ